MAAVYPKAASLIPYHTILPSLKLWRKTVLPKNPDTLSEFIKQYEKDENKKILIGINANLKVYPIVDENGKTHVLFYNIDLIKNEFKNTTKLLIDCTFQTTPTLKKERNLQIIDMMSITYDHALVFVYGIMTAKTQKAYEAVLEHVALLLDAEKVEVVLTDFETALRNAAVKSFPKAQCTGCNVHFDRANYRKLKSLHLSNYLKENKDAKCFVKKIHALAFLPEFKINEEYLILLDNTDSKIREKLKPYLQYFEKFWLKRVKPKNFSVFGLSVRTTNAIEANHSQLRHRLGTHPPIWDFVCKLVKLTEVTIIDIQRLKNRKPINRQPRYKTLYNRKELIRVWKMYVLNSIDGQKLLEMVSSLKSNLCKKIEKIHDDDGNIEDFQSTTMKPESCDPDLDIEIVNCIKEAQDIQTISEALVENRKETMKPHESNVSDKTDFIKTLQINYVSNKENNKEANTCSNFNYLDPSKDPCDEIDETTVLSDSEDVLENYQDPLQTDFSTKNIDELDRIENDEPVEPQRFLKITVDEGREPIEMDDENNLIDPDFDDGIPEYIKEAHDKPIITDVLVQNPVQIDQSRISIEAPRSKPRITSNEKVYFKEFDSNHVANEKSRKKKNSCNFNLDYLDITTDSLDRLNGSEGISDNENIQEEHEDELQNDFCKKVIDEEKNIDNDRENIQEGYEDEPLTDNCKKTTEEEENIDNDLKTPPPPLIGPLCELNVISSTSEDDTMSQTSSTSRGKRRRRQKRKRRGKKKKRNH